MKKKNNNKTNRQRNKQTRKQPKATATYNSPCLHYRWRCCQAIVLNDQQEGPTPLGPLSPQSNDARQ